MRVCRIAFVIFLALPLAAQTKHPFTFEDMMKLKRVGEPVPSPDGKWVIFSAVDVDLATNKKTPHIWIVPLDNKNVGTGLRPVQAEQSSASSSPAKGSAESPEPSSDWVLRDVSFVLDPGETVAVVGHTGAGKTTLISLLMRFYDVQKGAIRIDGVDIKDMDLKELRSRFGTVLQDPFLFSGTVAGNIRLGTEWIEDADVERAAEEVNLADFIRTLPGGFKEEVRERGSTLSTGQKQLISFARALAHDPKILILDEATSSVDTETEFRVRDALSRMVEGRTSLIIAHRLSTIQRADKIIVMHKGQVREMGSHQQLLAQRGIYWKLYQLQYKDQEINLTRASSPANSPGVGMRGDD